MCPVNHNTEICMSVALFSCNEACIEFQSKPFSFLGSLKLIDILWKRAKGEGPPH